MTLVEERCRDLERSPGSEEAFDGMQQLVSKLHCNNQAAHELLRQNIAGQTICDYLDVDYFSLGVAVLVERKLAAIRAELSAELDRLAELEAEEELRCLLSQQPVNLSTCTYPSYHH